MLRFFFAPLSVLAMEKNGVNAAGECIDQTGLNFELGYRGNFSSICIRGKSRKFLKLPFGSVRGLGATVKEVSVPLLGNRNGG